MKATNTEKTTCSKMKTKISMKAITISKTLKEMQKIYQTSKLFPYSRQETIRKAQKMAQA